MHSGISIPKPNLTMQLDTADTAAAQEMQCLKARIAQVWAQRERLKQALNEGVMLPSQGLRDLEAVDRELAELDMRFKRLWDGASLKTNTNSKEPV
jgi:hypothetical protein